ncbi:MAG: DNA polymerase IV [Bdellovibrionales bacterium]|nr:DNA polymerase IV [Bdellovibrionales bacterium]
MRKIIHLDMDCFYAAVEVRDRPELKGKPVVVGGRPDSRGVVATANYEARRFGIRSAMPSSRAYRLCPDAVFLKPDFSRYKQESRHIREIMTRYSPVIEPLSLDEAFLDVTGVELCEGNATRMAREMRLAIWEERGLTASAGIATNKLLAKIASEVNKPNGQKTVVPDGVDSFMKTLPVESLFGVGKVTARKLHQLGFKTCGQLQELDQATMIRRFGRWGGTLYRQCRGLDERPVSTSRRRKSLSVEGTFSQDYRSPEDARPKLHRLYDDLKNRWQRTGLNDGAVKTAVVKLKFHDFDQRTRSQSCSGFPSVDLYEQLYMQLWELHRKPFRLLGLGVDLADEKSTHQEDPQLSFL